VKKICIALFALSLWPACVFAAQPVVQEQVVEKPGDEGYVWNEMEGEKLIALKAKGDPVIGAVAFEVCQGCHRANASGRVSGAYPRLAGQHATVLIKQMADIRARRRDNPKMDPYIDEHVVTPQEIADIAAYLESLPISDANGKGMGDNLERGKEIYFKDCVKCHGNNGEGDAAQFYPMVAAQHYKYLLRESIYIRDNLVRRNGNPKMREAIKFYNDEDLALVSDFMSRMPPPAK